MVRIKNRYLLLNILYPDTNSFKHAIDTPDFLRYHTPTPQYVDSYLFVTHLRASIAAAFGDQGLGLCLPSLKVVYFSNATSTVILRVPRAHYQIVWASLSYMHELPAPKETKATAPKCVVRVVRVSGTIRKAEEELLRRNRQHIVRAQRAGVNVTDSVLSRLVDGKDVAASIEGDQDDASAASSIADASDSE